MGTKVALKANQDKAREESREGEKRKMKDLENQKAQKKELAKQRKLKKPPTVLDKKIASKASNDKVSAFVRQRKHEIKEENKKQAHQKVITPKQVDEERNLEKTILEKRQDSEQRRVDTRKEKRENQAKLDQNAISAKKENNPPPPANDNSKRNLLEKTILQKRKQSDNARIET